MCTAKELRRWQARNHIEGTTKGCNQKHDSKDVYRNEIIKYRIFKYNVEVAGPLLASKYNSSAEFVTKSRFCKSNLSNGSPNSFCSWNWFNISWLQRHAAHTCYQFFIAPQMLRRTVFLSFLYMVHMFPHSSRVLYAAARFCDKSIL